MSTLTERSHSYELITTRLSAVAPINKVSSRKVLIRGMRTFTLPALITTLFFVIIGGAMLPSFAEAASTVTFKATADANQCSTPSGFLNFSSTPGCPTGQTCVESNGYSTNNMPFCMPTPAVTNPVYTNSAECKVACGRVCTATWAANIELYYCVSDSLPVSPVPVVGTQPIGTNPVVNKPVGTNPSGNPPDKNISLINPLKSGDCTPNGDCLMEFLKNILKLVVRVGSIIVILMLVFVGYKFVAAQGKEAEIRDARNMLLWTVIGALILLGAEVIANTIKITVNNLL